eukprot:gene1604-1776_t
MALASDCKIENVRGASTDMLEHKLNQLYASILVGKSACRGFTKSQGHTGGFYHIVCRHGCTVASKFLILTESVRDAADLYLSLQNQPALFFSDTACTFVQHINNRNRNDANRLWDEYDGCFEVPKIDRPPKCFMNAPEIVPVEYSDGSQTTTTNRHYVMGDRFHTSSNPHKSSLCEYHNINLCLQANTVKSSYQESENHRKNLTRLWSSCMQNFHIHFLCNYLQNVTGVSDPSSHFSKARPKNRFYELDLKTFYHKDCQSTKNEQDRDPIFADFVLNISDNESEEVDPSVVEDEQEQDLDDVDGHVNEDSPVTRKRPSANQVPVLIDTKRKHLERNLSAAQRDKLLINEAKGEKQLRQDFASEIRESSSSFTEAVQGIGTVGTNFFFGNGLLHKLQCKDLILFSALQLSMGQI